MDFSQFSSQLTALGKRYVLSCNFLQILSLVQAQTTRRNFNCSMYALCTAAVNRKDSSLFFFTPLGSSYWVSSPSEDIFFSLLFYGSWLSMSLSEEASYVHELNNWFCLVPVVWLMCPPKVAPFRFQWAVWCLSLQESFLGPLVSYWRSLQISPSHWVHK